VVVLGLAAGLLAPTGAGGAGVDLDACAPGQNVFTLDIDNPFFPLPVGRQWTLVGEDDGEIVAVQITVLDEVEPLYQGTLTARVVEELEWLDPNGDGVLDAGEELKEVSRNYFAQTQDGTVCYLGEDVDIYEGGVVVSHEGAWRADTAGHAPGISMPASPKPGMTFQQEVAPGIAEDEAKVVGIGPVTVPAGTFRETIRLREFNPLDRGKGYKAYAQDVGIIVDSGLLLVRLEPGAAAVSAAGRAAPADAVLPVVVEPADCGLLVRGGQLTLAWTGVAGTAQYGIEYSGTNLAFTNPNGTTPDAVHGLGGAGGGFVVVGTRVALAIPADLPAGRYQLRVVGLTADGQVVGRFSDALTLDVP
jgi:hypothetical protein